MVYRVCQRVLRHPQDAEDAFQATFLVLARKGPALTGMKSLAGWLHRVAHLTSLKARQRGQRRQLHEKQAATEGTASEWADENPGQDLRPMLDQELSRLPEGMRTALVLCYLEGKTTEQVGRQLGCPKGTVLSWLARGRDRLRQRLERRGVSLSAAALTGALAREATDCGTRPPARSGRNTGSRSAPGRSSSPPTAR